MTDAALVPEAPALAVARRRQQAPAALSGRRDLQSP